MQAQALIFKQMQMSFPQMYRQCVRDCGVGPVSIFQHVALMAEFASIYPQVTQWSTFLQSNGVGMLCEVLLASGRVQNHHARAGDLVVHQTTGVPVGSFLSGVPLNLCLGGATDRHDKWLWPQIAQTFGLDSDRSSAFHVSRYEVDTLLPSYLLYSNCLYGIEKLTCFCEASSDRCDDFIVSYLGMTINKFLDLSIQISLDNLFLAMHRTNIVFILHRDHNKKRKIDTHLQSLLMAIKHADPHRYLRIVALDGCKLVSCQTRSGLK